MAVVCFVALAMPLFFLFSVPGSQPGVGPLSQLYSSLIVLLEEKATRFLFCAAWIGLDAALVWRLFFSRRRENDGGPLEGLGD